jgi:hypothetical protein
LAKNAGNCRVFNKAFALATGDFIIDFACDDVMTADKVSHQISFFQTLDHGFGVVFTDALYIDSKGQTIRRHYEYLFRKGLLNKIPQGDVYADVLSTYFIASPTMMVRTEVLQTLNGYDESLSYEDFDFWVRSARNFRYAYLDEVTMKIRRNKKSMSTGWYKQGDKQLYSTYLVCKKALELNRSKEDKHALVKRLQFEIRQSVFSENYNEAVLFYDLLKTMRSPDLFSTSFILLNKLRLPLAFLRNLYHRIRY